MNPKTFWLMLCICLPIVSSAQAPTQSASGLTFTLPEGNRISLSFMPGNGSRRIVAARAGSAVAAMPLNGVDYQANTTFALGQEIQPGSGAYIVYDGTGPGVTVTGLQPNSTYHFAVFEYNGVGPGTAYLMSPLTGIQQTAAAPAAAPSNLAIEELTGNSAKLKWDNGDGAGRLLLAKAGLPVDAAPESLQAYLGNPVFGTGAAVGDGNFVVYSGQGDSTTVTGLQPGITYHFSLFEYNGSIAPVYQLSPATAQGTTVTTPGSPGSNLAVEANDGGQLFADWEPGDGASRLVLAKEGSAVLSFPQDGETYIANTNFGQGDEMPDGAFVVYKGAGSSTTVRGLNDNTTYHFRVFEFNGTGQGNTYYLVNPSLNNSQATLGAPSVPSTGLAIETALHESMVLTWENGNRQNRLLTITENNPADAMPTNYQNFPFLIPNFSTAPSLQPGSATKAIYAGPDQTVTVTGLSPGQTYFFNLYDYNGFNDPVYLLPGTTTAGETASDPPPSAVSNLQAAPPVEGNRLSLSWDIGQDLALSRRIVVMRANSPVDFLPEDGALYTASNFFGASPAVAPGTFVVYQGTGDEVQARQLSPSTTYHVKVFEYYGSAEGSTIYQREIVAEGMFQTAAPPAITASAPIISEETGNSMNIQWSNGDGDGRIVICRPEAPVTVSPEDLFAYEGNNFFLGNPEQLQENQAVVFSGQQDSFLLEGLQPGLEYHFAIYEYNGANQPVYAVEALTFSASTLPAPPTAQATELQFSSVGATRMEAAWENGNGNRRLVIARKGEPVSVMPVDSTFYSPNGQFGQGDELSAGEFVVYDGTGSSFSLTQLEPGADYHLGVFEYNASDTATFYLAPPLQGVQSTVSPPDTLPFNLQAQNTGPQTVRLSWENGNGDGQLVLVTLDEPFDSNLIAGTTYAASPNYESPFAQQIGNAKVVFFSTGNSVIINNLASGATYRFHVFEYRGVKSSAAFSAEAAVLVHTTLGPPPLGPQELTVAESTPGVASGSIAPGNGQARMVIARAGQPVNAVPQDSTAYFANPFFGAGSEIGDGNYVIYIGPDTTFEATGFDACTSYFFAAYELNFPGPSPLFNTQAIAEGLLNTSELPSVRATDTIAVNAIGAVTLFASDLLLADNGNCPPFNLEARRFLDYDQATCEALPGGSFTPWSASLPFTCCDIGQSIVVEVRDLSSGYNGEVLVTVVDNLSPICQPPAAQTASCTMFGEDFDPASTLQLGQLFGTAVAQDNCLGATIVENAPSIDLDCGTGTIVRNFTAVDAGGRASSNSCTQVITLIDDSPPLSIQLNTPAELCASGTPDCSSSSIVSFTLSGGPCLSTDYEVSVFLAIGQNEEEDLSGALNAAYPNFGLPLELPLGTHSLIVEAVSSCGTSLRDTFALTVNDCMVAVPQCPATLERALLESPGGGQTSLTITATEYLESGLPSDCSLPLSTSINLMGDMPNPNQQALVFGCSQIGDNIVEAHVYDAAGNFSSCAGIVRIVDPFDACNGNSINIEGFVRTESDAGLQGAAINLSGNSSGNTQLTAADGSFFFTGLTAGNDYTLSPALDEAPLNGISTLDLLLISRHILGVQLLDGPYKRIAADANKSGNITTLDMIQLRKLILSIDLDFPNNTSWRFVPANYVFPLPEDPWFEEFPEFININNLPTAGLGNANFIAIKVGDVSGDAETGFHSALSHRGSNEEALFEWRASPSAGLELIYRGSSDLAAFQFSLHFPGGLPSWASDILSPGEAYWDDSAHLLNLAWHAIGKVRLKPGTAVLAVGRTSPAHISPSGINAVAYGEDLAPLQVEVGMEELMAADQKDFGLKTYPNPATHTAVLEINMPSPGPVRISCLRADGQLQQELYQQLPIGSSNILLHVGQWPEGIYYLRAETGGCSKWAKLAVAR